MCRKLRSHRYTHGQTFGSHCSVRECMHACVLWLAVTSEDNQQDKTAGQGRAGLVNELLPTSSTYHLHTSTHIKFFHYSKHGPFARVQSSRTACLRASTRHSTRHSIERSCHLLTFGRFSTRHFWSWAWGIPSPFHFRFCPHKPACNQFGSVRLTLTIYQARLPFSTGQRLCWSPGSVTKWSRSNDK